ncbi:MAG: 6-phosphogluconate dehydrogenase [Lewinellaceae bacterium]|nr:6-phosphogluconate dehydrogenase [Lewinellaceae bacterium]
MSIQFDQAKQKAGKFLRRSLWVLFAAFLVFSAGYYFWRTYPKSEGTRTGILFKISKKGYVFKTYEGQLQLGGTSLMTQQSVWEFSAQNQAVYEKLQTMEGKPVKCKYKELVNAFPWQGDTNYIVYDTEELQE